MSLADLAAVADLDRAVARSHERPVLIFKHSLACGSSAWALNELRRFLLTETADGTEAWLVTVQTDRPLSDEIERRLGVKHETPQVLVLRDGRVAWHGSHFRITVETLVERVAATALRSSPATK